MQDQDLYFMDRALALAQEGQYTTRPNPAVGCVFVKDQQILAEGAHYYAGGPHAEIVAILQAKEKNIDLKGSTCYVTLEPCCHFGKTPPCVQALIQAGVKRVVLALEDPNPQMRGRGRQALQNAGIEVLTDLRAEQAYQLNQGFLYAMRQHKPFVRAKLALSLDGRTALASGASQWITCQESRLDVQKLRARSGAIITGINTVLADNPALTVRPETWLEPPDLEIPPPLRVVCDSHFRIPLDAKVLQGPGEKWVVCAKDDPKKREALEKQDIHVLCLPDVKNNQVDCAQLLQQLYRYEIYDVLIEAGPVLTGFVVSQGLVNEFWAYIAPKFLGHEGRPLLFLPSAESLDSITSMNIISSEKIGQDIRVIINNIYS